MPPFPLIPMANCQCPDCSCTAWSPDVEAPATPTCWACAAGQHAATPRAEA